METLILGKTNVRVSSLCLGTMYLGSRTPKAMAYQLLDQYTAAGGGFLDTANMYARWIPGFVGGESETLLGQWMRERKNRDRMFVSSKVGFPYPGTEQGVKARQIIEECEKSLKRMGIETFDLYYAHVDDRNTPQEESLEAFSRLVDSGKVRFIGASNFLAWRLEEAHWISHTYGRPEYCCVQQRHSYLRLTPGGSTAPQVVANTDLFDYCRARNIILLAYSPLLGGAYVRQDKPLSDAYIGSDSDARLATLKAVAKEIGATLNQLVLAWMLHSDPRVIPIFGASTPEQMAENLGALDVQLSDAQMERLNTARG